ncbi:phosphatidylinositol 3-kinase catalytic subunit type 3 isoform X1 [Ostrinia furnacalis]|uniref:phosphatidylinositol 3-kinase catalytic subunit type 3 isoform X1 n=1 Tax=Ostrinia furnacalis TaxID=93504 RepID=UPI00103C3F32|nr:phosphatidylinositol 3-kinase catalytic subunit type 3 isoform X1 [Ostrinia furnacalis]XP_028155987.1 phosphatidylinositol 3-kinase catalytic subunit type 3 isoform X1 [Ostrinia furnacalis]
MNEIDDKFYYVYSSSLDYKVEIKIGTLEGKRAKPEYDRLLEDPMLKFSGLYQEGCSDLYVTCQVLSDGVPLALPVTTSYKAFTNRWNWNEWVTLPVYFSDLPRDATLAMTIYDCAGPGKVMVVGGTTISLFGKHGMLRQGMFDLRVWPGVEGSEKTPGKAPDRGKEQMQRLAKLAKKHRNGHMPKVDWLDRLTFREIEMINEKEKRSSDYMYLMIEFPTVQIDGINHAVVYYEQDGDEMYQFRAQADIVTVPDYEIGQENLVEAKQHRLARSLRAGGSGRDAKPTASERDHLAAIVAAPPGQPRAAADQDALWKFRFYLTSHRRALTKFLECVNWNRPGEVRQALAMMKQWTPMDVEDALELLTPKFTHPAVRKYAVSRLKQAPDEDLLLYLLQLVQALKYEDFSEIHEEYIRVCGKDSAVVYSDAEGKLMQSGHRGSQASLLSTSVLTSSEMTSSVTSRRSLDARTDDATPAEEATNDNSVTDNNNIFAETDGEEHLSLSSFLIERACGNSVVGNYLYWYLLIECEDRPAQDHAVRAMYLRVMRAFSHQLAKGNAELQRTRNFLARQQVFIDKLVKLVKTVTRESGNRNKKAERLQQLLADPDAFKFNFTNFEPMPFPLDPNVTIKGIVAKKASLFKSALMPSKLTFLTTEGVEYEAIFKHGDDLRQDQLILQMITLMDKLLRRENLDLKLTPYKVLATSSKHGFLQFIESITVAEALATEGSIQNFFRKHNPCEGAPYGIKPETMDTYIRSCAGYCVITYLLGVGDRHLDNLLLTKAGALFHIDFGYILGRDPKPLPPPMKLSKEMVEAMGGVHSEHYHEFRKQCYTAFLHLRRHANLMLNLFSLMVDASVPDIALEPDKAVKKVQDKLRLDLGDEEAVHYLQNLLDMSVTAVMAVLVEQFHKFAQYWRK